MNTQAPIIPINKLIFHFAPSKNTHNKKKISQFFNDLK